MADFVQFSGEIGVPLMAPQPDEPTAGENVFTVLLVMIFALLGLILVIYGLHTLAAGSVVLEGVLHPNPIAPAPVHHGTTNF